MAVLKQGYISVIEHFRQELKVYVGIIISTITILIGVIAWASENFLERKEAEMTHKQIIQSQQLADEKLANSLEEMTETQVEMNALITNMIAKQALSGVKTAIKTNESEQFQLDQFIRINGSDSQSEKRMSQLKSDRAELEIKRNCIINKNAICD